MSWSSNDKLQNIHTELTQGKNLITISAIESRNNSQNNLKTISLRLLTPNKIKLLLSNEYLKKLLSTGILFFTYLLFSSITSDFQELLFGLLFFLITAPLPNPCFKNK